MSAPHRQRPTCSGPLQRGLLLACGWGLLALGCGGAAAADSDLTQAAKPAVETPADQSETQSSKVRREVRATGTTQAVRYLVVQSPRISGQGSRLTLVQLALNGSTVQEGEVLAEFDPTDQLEADRQAEAKFEDLGHQVEQKLAENEAEAAKRRLQLSQAESELADAEIELRKGPLLSEIDRLKNETKAAAARAKVKSLRISSEHREAAEQSALRVLELQRERQRVALDRVHNNLSKLKLTAPLGGMVALEATWRNGSMGHAQEGDQIYPGRPLLRIFDPSEMEVAAYVAETDRGALHPGQTAVVELDAYPDVRFSAKLASASPVAASAIGSPIKTFLARFRLDQSDARLLPDLSAVVVLQVDEP
ncbi:MAG: HlyD family efflux transporter periplasmic adaptor subunit [Acidobacteria bacterium]|nr:HlyD family efflux transporter periplasmic adaptor subunit [Acidobacteriota bacterium]